MNRIVESLVFLYSTLLLLYPYGFREEFAEEMKVVFRDSLNAAIREGTLSIAWVCLKEFGGLPASILREVLHEFKERKTTMATSEEVQSEPVNKKVVSHWNALLGSLPFLCFGILSMLGKIRFPLPGAYLYLAFFLFVLIGLAIGLAKGAPRWTYSYLGWSVVLSLLWTMMPLDSFGGGSSPILHALRFGLFGLLPLLITLVTGTVRARSVQPLRQLMVGIWKDWTLLSLCLYAFGGYAFLIFDENHHPYLFAFMIATTLVIAASVWVYMKSNSTGKRVLSLLAGFLISYVIISICDRTWDAASYYGLPPASPEPWYAEITRTFTILLVWSVTLFWPVIIGLVRSISNRQKPPMAA